MSQHTNIKTRGRCDSSGKVCYASRADAKKVRERMPEFKANRPYLCDDCGWIHLGGKHGIQSRDEHRRIATETAMQGLGYPSVPVGHAAAQIGCGAPFLLRLIESGRVRGGGVAKDGEIQMRVHKDDFNRLMETSLRSH